MTWLILLSIFLFVMLVATIVILVFTIRSNFAMQDQLDQYNEFFINVSSVLQSDMTLIKTTLFQKFRDALNVPEVAEFARALTQFNNHLITIQSNLKLFGFEVPTEKTEKTEHK